MELKNVYGVCMELNETATKKCEVLSINLRFYFFYSSKYCERKRGGGLTFLVFGRIKATLNYESNANNKRISKM